MGNPRIIAKNGFLLFVRMLFVMFLTFYTTRLALAYLGDEDFGINNIVGGITVIFAIVTMPITNSIQRFLNVEFAKNNIPHENVFCSCRHVVNRVIMLLLLLYETAGLFIVNNVIVIPEDRIFAANVVYQVTALTSVFNFLYIPYQSLMFAEEDMSIPAYAEMSLAVFRIAFLMLLPFVEVDHLIGYSFILLIGQFVIYIIYKLYSKRKYSFLNNIATADNGVYGAIVKFTGWNFLEAISGISMTYGISFILNIFGGVLYNTAYGISRQIANAVLAFTSQTMKAVEPQLTSSTAIGDSSYRDRLVTISSMVSFLIVCIITVVFYFVSEDVISFWLGKVPMYSLEIINITLVSCIASSVILPFRCLILAIGDIKNYFIGILLITIIGLSIMCVLLTVGVSITVVVHLIYIEAFLKLLWAFYILKIKSDYQINQILVLLLKVTAFIALLFGALACIRNYADGFWLLFSLSIILSTIVFLIVVNRIILKKEERNKMLNTIKRKIL